MLVLPHNLDEVISTLLQAPAISLDTETTGLYPWQNDTLFAISCSTEKEDYYFDTRNIPAPDIAELFNVLLGNTSLIVHMINAKFDMAFLWKFGVTNILTPTIIDAQVTARLMQNDLMSVSMASLAPWVGLQKDKSVEKWAEANDAWEWEATIEDDGKVTKHRNIRYDKIPVDVMQPYAELDARITFNVGVFILNTLKERDEARPNSQPSVLPLLNEELKLTKVLFKMEMKGALVDTNYINDAFEYETKEYEGAAYEFEESTGIRFKNSGKVLGEAFEKFAPEDKHRFKQTGTGMFCTQDAVISTFTSPLARIVQRYRNSYKRAGTYFAAYSSLVDNNGRIHTSFRQSGTRSGRLSCAAPNLQNVTKGKDKESSYPVRRSFISPEDFYWGSIDYNAMEYKLLLNYSGERQLVDSVLQGVDLHQTTADMMGVSRTEAKTINFALLYGSGVRKLAEMLGTTVDDARELKELYFSKLPMTSEIISRVTRQAEVRKYIHNWCGRVYHFSDPRLSYKAPNYLIQGGSADVVKIAMVRVDDYLESIKCRSKMILQVHDALEFYIHKDELDILPKCKEIMESVYPYRHVPLTASIEISDSAWSTTEDFNKWLDKKKVTFQTK